MNNSRNGYYNVSSCLERLSYKDKDSLKFCWTCSRKKSSIFVFNTTIPDLYSFCKNCCHDLIIFKNDPKYTIMSRKEFENKIKLIKLLG